MPMTPQELDDFRHALAFAARLHATQVRKETDIPYISHLIAVAGIVMEQGGSRDEAIAALLHDSIEDQADRYEGGAARLRRDIREHFGAAVLEIVEACTDGVAGCKPEWRQRKQDYLDHLQGASPSVRLVSCADKLHNARAIVGDLRVVGDSLWNRFKGGREGSLWYYRALADEFVRGGPPHLAAELDRAVCDMERLAASR